MRKPHKLKCGLSPTGVLRHMLVTPTQQFQTQLYAAYSQKTNRSGPGKVIILAAEGSPTACARWAQDTYSSSLFCVVLLCSRVRPGHSTESAALAAPAPSATQPWNT